MQKKHFVDSIRVADPCSENWDEMTGTDQVRFCTHCAKDVNNISTLTKKEAMRLVRKSRGRLCVRYRTEPRTNRPIFKDSVARAALTGAAAGILGASLLSGNAYAQGNAESFPLVQIERVQNTGDASAKISGYVTDPDGAAIAYALVSITNQETLHSQVQNASAEGFYEFKDLPAGKYKLRFEGGGFASQEIENVYASDASEIRRDGKLSLLQVSETVEVKAEKVEWQVTVGVIAMDFDSVPANPLVTAVLDEELGEIKVRVTMGSRINVRDKSRDGMSPLHAAVETGNLEIVEYLLAHGAKTNIRDYDKLTPLMMMDEDATPELFQLLVRYGAKLNLLDKQKNNILHHLATRPVDAGVIKLVATYGVPVNGLNKEGKTPLMLAVENGMDDHVRALIENGADVNIRARDGRTALGMVSESDTDIRSILETFGAVSEQR